MSFRNRGEKMSTRKENYNSCKRWTNWKGDVETEHRMPQTGNLGAIQRHSLSRKLPKWLTMHKKNQDLSTATEFSFIKSQTCGNNYTVSFLTHLSKILLCIHFKRIVTKKQPPKSTVQKKRKSPHKASCFYTFYTNEELWFNPCLLWKKVQPSDWKPFHSSFVNFAQKQLK